ncbi:MAG: hypothetical protein ACRDH7_07910 [Actinomycetota bacterium]
MSTKAGTIQGTQTGISWAGGRIAAILLIAILAVTLFAMTRGGTVERTPASTRFEVTQQLSGGRNVMGVTSRTLPGGQPVMIGSYACHQCR